MKVERLEDDLDYHRKRRLHYKRKASDLSDEYRKERQACQNLEKTIAELRAQIEMDGAKLKQIQEIFNNGEPKVGLHNKIV